MSEAMLTREQIESWRAQWLSDPDNQPFQDEIDALCTMALASLEAEQKGRAAGLTEAVNVVEGALAKSRAAENHYAHSLLRYVHTKLRALSTSPGEHVLVPAPRPIAEAPKDGTEVLLIGKTWHCVGKWVQWAEQWRDATSCKYEIKDPIAFIPQAELPQPRAMLSAKE